MTTTIRWERGVAGQVAAHLISDDGGHALVHCMVPGGRPRFLPRLDADWDTSIVDAPSCDTFADFKRFVEERFGDDDSDGGYVTAATLWVLCAVIALATILASYVGDSFAAMRDASATATSDTAPIGEEG